MLTQLKEYYHRHAEKTPLLYQRIPIRYVVDLKADGSLRNPVPIDRATGAAKSRAERGKEEAAPNIVRTSSPVPQLFADGSDYTFGVDPAGKPAQVSERHRLYMEMVQECAATTGEKAVIAVRDFLAGGVHPAFPADFDYGAEITFSVEGVMPIDLPAVQQYWVERFRARMESLAEIPCVVCGRLDRALEGYPARVKGVLGGQTAGTFIVSANAEPFLSYGLKGSQVSPTCLECADEPTKAINALIAGGTSHLYMGGTTFIFWTRERHGDFDVFSLVTEPTSETIALLLRGAQRGKESATVETDRFYAASLSGSGGRTVVRDWIDTTVDSVQASLQAWFRRQEIVDWNGTPGQPFGIRPLAGATLPLRSAGPDWDRLPATVSRALLRTAFTGAPLPPDVLHRTIQRTRAERDVRRVHAALIKLALLSQQGATEGIAPVSLNPDHPETAYQCGRLLAVLEEAQRAAMPRVTNTIVDRFFGTASSAPATVFGRLMRGAQPHLSTLETSNPRAYGAIQRKLEDVSRHIPGFPTTLTLQEQGLFALGYYHQRAYRNPPAPGMAATDPSNDTPEN